MAELDQYSAEEAAIKRRQRVADALMAQGQQPIDTQTASGYVVPVSPLSGLDKIGQNLAGAYIDKRNEARSDALNTKKIRDVFNMINTNPNGVR